MFGSQEKKSAAWENPGAPPLLGNRLNALPSPLRLLGWLVAGAVLLLLLSWYWRTMPPGLSSLQISGWNDATEFQTVGAFWGLEHSPGYPLYTVAANLFVRLIGLFSPGTEPAWRVSFFSLVTTLPTLALFFGVLLRLRVHPLLAGSTTFFLGSTRLFWQHAIVAEVYMLNLTLILLALWLALGWREAEQERGYLVALGLTFGAMAAHHRTALLLVPILVGWMLLSRRDSWQRWLRRLLWIGLSGAPMLLLYAYLPLSVQWNEQSGMARIYADASDPRMMLSMIQSREWWEVVQFPATPGEAWQELTHLLALQGEQLRSPMLVALGALGLLVGGYVALPMALLSLAFLYFGLSYNVYDIDTMLIPLTTMLLIGVALALQKGIDLVGQRPAAPRWLAPALLVALAVPLLGSAYRSGSALMPSVDQSSDTVGMDFMELLALMAEGGEPMSVIAYQHAPLAVVQYTRARYDLPNLEPLYANRLDALPPEEVRAELRARWAEGRAIYFTREVVDLKLVGEIVEGLAEGRYRQAPTYFPDLFYLLPTDGLPPVAQRPAHPLTFEANGLALQGYDQRWIERRSGVYLELTLYWEATAPIKQEHTLTLWPAGPLEGALESVQLDGLMLGALPVTTLKADEQVRDVYQLRLNLPPASYEGAAVGLTLQPQGEGEAATVMVPISVPQ